MKRILVKRTPPINLYHLDKSNLNNQQLKWIPWEQLLNTLKLDSDSTNGSIRAKNGSLTEYHTFHSEYNYNNLPHVLSFLFLFQLPILITRVQFSEISLRGSRYSILVWSHLSWRIHNPSPGCILYTIDMYNQLVSNF